MNDTLALTWGPRALSVLRIAAGLLFLQHGTQKLLSYPLAYSGTLNALMTAAGVIELVGGILLILGALTRPVAFIASGFCAVAYFMAHAPQNFFPIMNRGELAALYSFVFLYICVAGPGPWSVDALLRERRGLPATA